METLTGRVSAQWKQLGFQGTDPVSIELQWKVSLLSYHPTFHSLQATDFRGSGVVGLQNMLYLADNYPSSFQRFVRTKEAYPFAISGLNLTMLLFELLGWGMKKEKGTNARTRKHLALVLFGKQNVLRHSFEKVTSSNSSNSSSSSSSQGTPVELDGGALVSFHELYCLLFHVFDRRWHAHQASYMDFPVVKQSTQKEMMELLQSIESRHDVVAKTKEMSPRL
jgi:engulfment and cell motility protein 2